MRHTINIRLRPWSEILNEDYFQVYTIYNLYFVCSDGFLNIEEFDGICKGLFRNDRGIVYSLDVHTLKHIFNIFDTKKVCKVD